MSNSESDAWKLRFDRERKARKAAERILEEKSYELYLSNEALKTMNANLEEMVELRSEELENSESRFRFLVESASDIIYRVNKEGYFSYANPRAMEMLGYRLDELKKFHFTDLVAETHKSIVANYYAQKLSDKKVQSYLEFPVVSKEGKTIWIGQNVTVLYSYDNEPSIIAAVARDISDAKIAQSRLENLITNMQSGILLESAEREIVLTNQIFCDKFGIPAAPEQLVGADCSMSAEQSKGLFTDEEGFVSRIDEILTQREIVRSDILAMKNGRILERDYIPIFLEGSYSGHLWNYRDVTEKHEFLRSLSNSEEKYRGIIANMNLGLIEVDLDEKIRYVNHSFEELSGYSSDELIGKNASKIFLLGDNRDLMSSKNDQRKRGVSDAYELAVKNKRGELKWWLISGAPLQDDRGNHIGSIGIHLDITSQKELEYQLIEAKKGAEESSRSKEAFLANMSHEIRTPMNGIIGMTRQISKSNLDTDQRFYVDTIKSAADNLMVILNDILDLSKIEAGKLNIENVPFHFEKALSQSCQVLKPKAEEKGLSLQTTLDARISERLCGDPHRLNQILLNLIGNAIKFTDKGSIDLSTTLVERNEDVEIVEIRVKDQGIGMDKDFMSNLFEKFTQEDRSSARKYGGTGLGMNITQQLVALMNGEISVSSEKNIGTEITVRIPFKITQEDETSIEADHAKDYTQLKGKRVLIAEDNELNQIVAESTLKPYELEITFVGNGLEAIEEVKKNSFDVVLMDVQMPEMDGLTATRIIRQELGISTPIIALTANAIKGDSEKFKETGMNDHVSKPFDEELLLDALLKHTSKALHSSVKTINNINESTPPIQDALYSLEKLKQISRGDQNFVDRMVKVFIEQSQTSINEMNLSFSEENYDAVSKIAHRMKPSIDNLMIFSLTKEVRELEKLAKDRSSDEKLGYLIGHFSQVLSDVLEDLKLKGKY